ncbi:MAG: S1 RNA-binding domain-containing protein [Acidimicrobiales bacterium]|jgi:hypothetical protein
MAASYAVVDGSNIATEGRSVPSLAQLDEAVRQFQAEFPEKEVIVVVDATFGHRIDPSERKAFDEAVAHAELVSPPAGAVGRGDAFLLRVAERVGAQVLSNDSFQEFHGEHPWLFDEDRLIGGKPVPGVGWIFTPRSPVRGVRSRAALAIGSTKAAKATRSARTTRRVSTEAGSAPADRSAVDAAVAAAGVDVVTKKAPKSSSTARATKAEKTAKAEKPAKTGKAAKSAKKTTEPAAKSGHTEKAQKAQKTQKADKAQKAQKTQKGRTSDAAPTTDPAGSGDGADAPGAPSASRGRRGRGRRATAPDVRAAIDVATVEAVDPSAEADVEAPEPSRRRRTGPPPAVNDPLTFLTFVSDHPIGATVDGVVSSFVSHGAMVDVGGMQCYVPLAGLASPAPRRAREVVERGEQRRFVLVALDPARRGAELALPEVAEQRLER